MKLTDFYKKEELNPLFIAFSFKEKEIKKYWPKATFIEWDKIILLNGNIFVKDTPISAYSCIFIGLCKDNERKFSVVQDYLKTSKVKHLLYGSTFFDTNKPLQHVKFKQAGLNQPKTVIGLAKELTAIKLVKELKLPIISKILNGSQGKGIVKHETQGALAKFLADNKDTDFIFQEFIPNDFDIRVFFLKGEILFAIKRTRQKKGEFRNNVSLGGSQEFIDLDIIPKNIAMTIDRCFGLDFAGVDIMQATDSKLWYVLETNSAPQFKDKEHLVIPKIIEYLK